MLRGRGNYRFRESEHLVMTADEVDFTAGTGVLHTFPVTHARIQVIEFGYHRASVGAFTTAGVIQLNKTPGGAGGVSAIMNSKATLTISAGADNTNVSVDLDTNSGVEPVPGPPSYPQAVAGDVLTIVQDTQGAGSGDQLGWPYFVYRVIDDRNTVATEGVGSGPN